MTNTKQATETNARGNDKPKLPTHVAKVRHGYGKKATYERIGVAWRNSRSFVWFQGMALFAYAKIVDFEDAIRDALSRGIEIRVLLMHPDNPALEHMLRDYAPNNLELVRKEILAGADFWKRFSDQSRLTTRFQQRGAMFENVLQSDSRIIFTQYSLARSTSESPTVIASAGVLFLRGQSTGFRVVLEQGIARALM